MNNNTGDNIPLYIRKKKKKNQLVKSTYTSEQLRLLKLEYDIERKQKGYEAYCRLREKGILNITTDMIDKESYFGRIIS